MLVFNGVLRSSRVLSRELSKSAETVAKGVELADEFVKQGESEAQGANDITSVLKSAVEAEVVSLSANLEKAREEAASTKVELEVLRAKAELDTKENSNALARVHEERQDEVKTCKVTTSRNRATLAKVRDESSPEVHKLRSERDGPAARHRKLLASIRLVVKAREQRNGKAADIVVKLRRVYDEGRRVTVDAHVAEWSVPRERVASSANDSESKSFESQTISGLVTEAARLRKES